MNNSLHRFRLAIIISSALILICPHVFAQAPGKMSYQALIRNSSDKLVVNTKVSIRISILKSSVSGTSVYTETHQPTTNGDGMVSLEIGTGTIVSGSFTAINWANGPYFLKTETDLAGGTNYTISGTSQLLSIPYALYANTVAYPPDNYKESDPVFIAWDKDYNDLTNKPVITNEHVYSVGDFAQGGIVFWVDQTGHHGLVCAKSDYSTTIRWNAGTNGTTQAKGVGLMAGKANTAIIIAAQVTIGDDGDTYAARACNEMQVTEGGITYGDWYLPSVDELKLIYQNRSIINSTALANGGGSFSNATYWSSTEASPSTTAYYIYFLNGIKSASSKSGTFRLRAVRSF